MQLHFGYTFLIQIDENNSYIVIITNLHSSEQLMRFFS